MYQGFPNLLEEVKRKRFSCRIQKNQEPQGNFYDGLYNIALKETTGDG